MKLIVFVTDIGGPPALHEVLSQLPSEYKKPILILPTFNMGIYKSASAALERTIQLPITTLDKSTELQSGNVYFAKSEIFYTPQIKDNKIILEEQQGDSSYGLARQTLQNLAEVLGKDLIVIFLSGKGKGKQIIAACQALCRNNSKIILLSRLDSLVFEMGEQILKHNIPVEEIDSTEIVHLLNTYGLQRNADIIK